MTHTSIYGGSKEQKNWLPVIDIERDTSWTLLGFKTSFRIGQPAQILQCKCGRFKIIHEHVLRRQLTKLCRQCVIENPLGGVKNPRLYKAYCAIIQRCENPKSKVYNYYGGRGISLCREWRDSFEDFARWALERGYNDGLTIERNDVNGNYCRDNCSWVTQKDQMRNTRRNVFLEFNGERKCVSQWSEELGISAKAIYNRIESGWSVEETLTCPVEKRRKKVNP